MTKFEMEYVIEAITKINPDAEVRIVGDQLNTCTIEWFVGDEISKSDIQTKIDEIKVEEISTATTKENNKASGKTKLKAGEALTDAEISALFGE